MPKFLYFLFLCLILTDLAGCATQSARSISLNNTQSLKSQKTWDLNGILSIRTAQAAETLHWSWKQAPEKYTLILSGPLGIGSARITGTRNTVLLETSDGKKFQAKNAAALLAQQTGWKLPIDNLYYWIRALPVPKINYHAAFNSQQQISTIVQNHWKIQYIYTSRQIFPAEITLKNASIFIRVIVR